VADCHFVLATSSRARALNLPVQQPRAAMPEICTRLQQGQKVAILFGPERTGLENEELILADTALAIAVSEFYPSLNLAQAVAVLAYEFKTQIDSGQPPTPPATDEPAAKGELEGMFGQLETALDGTNFWRVADKKPGMWRNIRAGLTRAQLSSHEVATWRGIIRALIGK
jgi:tRNA/rRNA methyltransferase